MHSAREFDGFDRLERSFSLRHKIWIKTIINWMTWGGNFEFF